MKQCSKYAFISREQTQQVDTNVVSIGFDILKDALNNVHQGDHIECQQCKCVLNKHSKLTNKNGKALDFQNNCLEFQQLWVCEFCQHENLINVEQEEIPKNDDVVYLLQSAQQKVEQTEQTIVFCIDNSGSMSMTKQVKGAINLKHSMPDEELEMLKKFMEPQELMFFNQQQQHATHISRKQCVLAAIEDQINELKQTCPNKIVGIVAFNNEVTLFGDGTEQPVVIAGDRLDSFDQVQNITKQCSQQILNKPIHQSFDLLINKFAQLQEKGQTALGPALLSAINLADKPGSAVIICTDGLANMGLGSFEGDQQAVEQFYEMIGNLAYEKGIAVSVVSIKGEGCKLETLIKLAQKTNGYVTKVDPEDLGSKFANILKDEIVGTKVDLIVKLHAALKFRNELEGINEEGNQLCKHIGNATVKTQVTFEYQFKGKEELMKKKINLDVIKEIPFQAKIIYLNKSGDKLMRVLTQMVQTTKDIAVAEKEAKIEIIQKRVHQQTAKMARQGQVQQAQDYNNNWNQYMNAAEDMNIQQDSKSKNIYEQKAMKIQNIMIKQQAQVQQVVEEEEQDQGDLFDMEQEKD